MEMIPSSGKYPYYGAPVAPSRRSYIGCSEGKVCNWCDNDARWSVKDRFGLVWEWTYACNAHSRRS